MIRVNILHDCRKFNVIEALCNSINSAIKRIIGYLLLVCSFVSKILLLHIAVIFWYAVFNEIQMDTMIQLLGTDNDLLMHQMCFRALLVFLISLLFLRISGRRSFGMRTPQDNIIAILLGALMSRAIVGASPFFAVMGASFTLVVLHRIFAWIAVHNKAISKLLDGDKICLYRNRKFLKENMSRALVSEEDIMQGIRKSVPAGDLNEVELIYMERNGEISIIERTKK